MGIFGNISVRNAFEFTRSELKGGLDVSWGYRVDLKSVGRPFHGEGPGQLLHAPFSRAIGSSAGIAD